MYLKKATGSSKYIFIVLLSIISVFIIFSTFLLYNVFLFFKASIVNAISSVVKLVPSCQFIFSFVFIIYVLSFIFEISCAKSFSISKFLFTFTSELNTSLSTYCTSLFCVNSGFIVSKLHIPKFISLLIFTSVFLLFVGILSFLLSL